LDALFYWLNRHAKRTLTFHNVLPDDMMMRGASVGLTISLSEFKKIIDWVAERFEFTVDVDDPRTVTITFDDGYKNQYEIAGKWLMQRKIPAILFVSGQVINAQPEGCLKVDFKALEDCSMQLQDLPSKVRVLRYAGVTEEDISDLRKHGWIVGWHTKSHRPLSYMSVEEQRCELTSPPAFLDVPMSYPFGMWDTVSSKTIKIAEELGYPCAFSNDDYYTPMLRGNFYRIRFTPKCDKYDIHFLLSGFKYFLQSFRLLPCNKKL
jgi:peptidoglycan/xylan/chitin deacetylase (PgdA/CDA1 family)